MGNKRASKRMTARRAATFLATLGVLVMSSGVALMVAATPANAAPGDKVVVCKYVSTPGGVLDHIVVVADDTLPDDFNGSFPFIWTDAQGQSEAGSIAVRYADAGPPPEQAKDIATSECPSEEPEDVLTTASVTFTDPTCENGNVASYVASGGEGVTFDEPAAAPGAAITVSATVADGYVVDGPTSFDHTFAAAEADCVIVDPPGGETPTVIVDPPGTTVTPTVVSAGLGEVSSDLRGEQGLALIFAGMVLMVAAGGLGLRGRASRI